LIAAPSTTISGETMNRTLRALGATAALVLVAGLLGTGSAVAGETTSDPMGGAPAVGACYDLTLKQANLHAAPARPVPCSGRHTMVVTAVGTIPASVDWATLDLDKRYPAALRRAIDSTCNPAVRKLLGSETRRALTLYQDYFFAPTEAEIEAGARWFSCEVVLRAGNALLPMPQGQPAKLGRTIPDQVARCAKAVKSEYVSVACSRAHQWRATYTKAVRGKLTDKTLLRAAERTCPRHVTSKRWLYYGQYSSRAKTFIVGCSDKTRR
jgi:hypothetical protein